MPINKPTQQYIWYIVLLIYWFIRVRKQLVIALINNSEKSNVVVLKKLRQGASDLAVNSHFLDEPAQPTCSFISLLQCMDRTTEMPTLPLLVGSSCFYVMIPPSQAGCTYSRFSRFALVHYHHHSLLHLYGNMYNISVSCCSCPTINSSFPSPPLALTTVTLQWTEMVIWYAAGRWCVYVYVCVHACVCTCVCACVHDHYTAFPYACMWLTNALPSVLWPCWLSGRKGIRPVKKLEWWDAGVIICLVQDADLHMAQLMPLPLTIFCSSKSRFVLPSWFYLSVASSPGWSQTKSKSAVKWFVGMCVNVL